LVNMYDRLEMVNLAIEDSDRLSASDIEFRLPLPSYTIDTLIHLQERYPRHEFTLIMGSDNLLSLDKWKNAEVLLSDYRIFVYPRPGFTAEHWKNHSSVTITDTPLMELSSTFIRSSLKQGKSVRYFLTDKVLDFIDRK